MGGGQVAIRGYLVQTLIALLEAVDDQRPWRSVTLEPNVNSDKVDVLWQYEKSAKAVQVKSSQNPFSKPDVERWAKDLESWRHADEYELVLVGTPASHSVAEIRSVGKVTVHPPKNLDLRAFKHQAAHCLDRFLRNHGLPEGNADYREMLAGALAEKLATLSTDGRELTRDGLVNLLRAWISTGLDPFDRLLYIFRLAWQAASRRIKVVACAAVAVVCTQVIVGLLAWIGTDARKLIRIEIDPPPARELFLRVAGQSMSLRMLGWSILATAMEGVMFCLARSQIQSEAEPQSKSKNQRLARKAIVVAGAISLLMSLSLAAVKVHQAIRPSVRLTPPHDVKEFGVLIEGTIVPQIFANRIIPDRLSIRIAPTPDAAKSYKLDNPMLFDVGLQPPAEADYFTRENEDGTWELDARFLRANGKYRINVRLVPLNVEGALDNTKPLPDAQKLVRIEIDPPPQQQLALSTD